MLPRNGHGVTTRPGSGLAYVATQAGLVLVDGKAEHALLTVPLGIFPFGIAVDADGTAYVGDRAEHTVTGSSCRRRWSSPGSTNGALDAHRDAVEAHADTARARRSSAPRRGPALRVG